MSRSLGYFINADAVRSILTKSGKSIEEVVDTLGCHRSYLNSALNKKHCAKKRFSLNFVCRLAKVFGVPAEAFIVEQKQSKPQKSITIDYGKLVNGWIAYSKMSCGQVERASGISREVLRAIRKNKTKTPRFDTLEKLATAFGVSYEDFIAGPDTEDVTEGTNNYKTEEIKLPFDTEIDETEEPVCESEELVQHNWLDSILEEEVRDAHKGFKAATKPADKKCFATIVCMFAELIKGRGYK